MSKKQSKREFLTTFTIIPHCFALALVLCGTGLAAKAQTPKPNIVIIVADDMGWNDVGYHGGIPLTPNLDALAAEGVRLENWHVMPLCSVTRAGFMTGRWPIRFGMGGRVITPWWRWGMATTEHTIADLLGEAGYARRGAFGKWHLGHHRQELLPLNRGFTTYYGGYNGSFGYFTHERNGELDWHRDWDSSFDVGYSTDLLGQEAADFIADSPANEPFFLYVPFNAPHTPLEAKPEDIATYAAEVDPDRRVYQAMVDSMDQAVGVILQALDDKGVADNTFVLFFSDNGALSQFGDNTPWRGAKGTVYEGGVRTPALVRWPDGGISGGGSIDGLMGIIDVYPTLKGIAGVTSEDPNPIDGIDLLEIMRGNAVAPVRDWFSYIAQQDERTALTDDTWKMVVTGGSVLDVNLGGGSGPPVELFDIENDPFETTNLLGAEPAVAAAMLERLQTFRLLKIDGIPDPTEDQAGFVAPFEWNIADGEDITASSPFAVEGESFSLVAPGSGPFKWYFDDVEIVGETLKTLNFSSLVLGDEGIYRVDFDDVSKALATSNDFLLSVTPLVGLMPVTGLMGLGLLAGACALGGTAVLRRKK